MVLVLLLFIIPTGISWKTWLNMYPVLEAVVKCESNYNPAAVGDHGKSIGIFQIHLPAHPDVSRAEAKDPWFSLAWAIDKYYKGEIGIWSCYHILVKQGKIIEEL